MAEINKLMFREYDIRGVAGEDLKEKEAGLIGKAFGTLLIRAGQKETLVGRDCRVSSPSLSKAFIAGILSTGCSAVDIGLASHGLVHYALRFTGKGNAAFVTASHNPPKFNGFKLVVKEKSIFGKQIYSLVDLIEKEDFETGKGALTKVDVVEKYSAFLKSKVKLKRKVKLVVDCGNGMASMLMPRLLEELGCEVKGLYCELDGSFPNHPADPVVAANLKDLIDGVRKEKAEFGIAFDGDGDRLGAVDENGKIIWGDQLTAIFSKQILAQHQGGKIVFEVNCSQALEEVIRKNGGVPVQCRVGHSIIEDVMHKEKALLAGEMSGHLFFADNFYGIDDAVYVALRFIELASSTAQPVSSFLKDYPVYFSSSQFRPHCADEKKFEIVKKIAADFKKEGCKIIELDGAKVLFEDGWGIVRASNTAPQLTLRFEGKTESAMQRIKQIFVEKLKKHRVDFNG